MFYGLIDESGRLYDPNDRIPVLSLVITDDLNKLEKIVTNARKRIPTKGKRRKERLSEIKFSLTGDKTRFFILKELSKTKVKIYVLIIDKQGRKILDSPENYSLLMYSLMKNPREIFPDLKHLILDKHFTFITQREQFNNLFHQRISKAFLRIKEKVFVEHVDSLQNPVVTIADFVAGAIRLSYTKNDLRFTEEIKNLIVEEKLITWVDLKRISNP